MRVRSALAAHGFTEGGVTQVLGPNVADALGRDQPDDARRLLAARDDQAAMLIELLLVGDPVPTRRAIAGGLPVEDLVALGVVTDSGGQLAPELRIEPFIAAGGQDAWVVSDFRRTRPLPADHVLGLGGAATSLASLTIREPVASALDLGTGGGVQLVHLAHHVDELVGTDLNPRALALARLTLGLNGITARLLAGDRYAPVKGERFDLIVANPPMVIGAGSRFAYRDSGLEGDSMSASVTRDSVRHLTPGGRSQLLAHWLHVRGQDWRERVAGWVPEATDAWVVQREVLEPERYVDLWLSDGGDTTGTTDPRREAWLGWFAAHRVEAIGMGWISQQRTDGGRGTLRLEDVRHEVDQPVGRAAAELLAAWRWLRRSDDRQILATILVVPPDVQLTDPGPSAGTGPASRPELVQLGRLRRRAPTDGFGARVVALCDGQRTLAQVLGVVGGEFGFDLEDVLEGALDAVQGLVETGFLEPLDLKDAAPNDPPV